MPDVPIWFPPAGVLAIVGMGVLNAYLMLRCIRRLVMVSSALCRALTEITTSQAASSRADNQPKIALSEEQAMVIVRSFLTDWVGPVYGPPPTFFETGAAAERLVAALQAGEFVPQD